jgi:hypothetical protein
MPGPSKEQIERQEAITAAFHQLWCALSPMLAYMPGKNTAITLTRTVSGDRVSVTLKPGADK